MNIAVSGHRTSPQHGSVVWFTGLSGAGKTTIANIVYRNLRAAMQRVELLDGDAVRKTISAGLSFTRRDRIENISRIGYICELLSKHQVTVLVAAISPYRSAREDLRKRLANFVEIYVDCPLEVLISRDVKGLYKRAIAGELPHFTGISDPYEPPESPDLVLDTATQTPYESAEQVMNLLSRRGVVAL